MLGKSRLDDFLEKEEDFPNNNQAFKEIFNEEDFLEKDEKEEEESWFAEEKEEHIETAEDISQDINYKESPERYVPLKYVLQQGRIHGIKIPLSSLKYKIDHGKIAGVRDQNDTRKKRLVPIQEIPNIIVEYTREAESKRYKHYSLADLALSVGLKERSLHFRAEKMGISTFRIGNRRMLHKNEYLKWKLILSRRQKRKEEYVTVGTLARQFGVSRFLVLYHIKRGRVPAEKIGNIYQIPKKEFLEHAPEWKIRCGYGNGEVKV